MWLVRVMVILAADGVCIYLCSCLWIAVKFMETPATIGDKAIKRMLQQRRHSGNVRVLPVIHPVGVLTAADSC